MIMWIMAIQIIHLHASTTCKVAVTGSEVIFPPLHLCNYKELVCGSQDPASSRSPILDKQYLNHISRMLSLAASHVACMHAAIMFLVLDMQVLF